MNWFFVGLLGFAPFFLKAQYSNPSNNSDSLIRLNIVRSGRYSGVAYTVSNEVLSNSALKSLLNTYRPSGEELTRYHSQNTFALILLPVSIAAMVAGAIQGHNNKSSSGSEFTKAPVFFSVSIAGLVGSMIISCSNNHRQKAIDIYNKRFR